MKSAQQPETVAPDTLEEALTEARRERDALQRRLAVEEALDRVRARTMAMQESAELGAVIKVVFQEALRLGFGAKACDLVILDAATGASTFWISGELDTDDGEALHFRVPALDHPHYAAALTAWANKETVRQAVLEGEDCAGYMRLLTTSAEGGNTPDDVKEFIQALRYIVHTEAYMRHGYFRVASLEPLSEEAQHILQRFAQVFEQTYTRFLDLKQAEAQARESEIQLALERVRAHTMAMHHSDELAEAASVLFQQLLGLGIKAVGCAFIIVDSEKTTGEVWLSADGQVIPRPFLLSLKDDPAFTRIFAAWESGEAIHVEDLSGEVLSQHLRYLVDQGMPVHILEAAEASQTERLVIHAAFFAHGFIGVNYTEPLDDQVDLLIRFARVFEQTYTRFLDLKKAEEQARESEIQLALERVRARTMAMHKSEELREVVSVLYEQLDALGLADWGCSIMIFDKASNRIEYWVAESTGSDLNSYYVEGQGHPVYKKLWALWEQHGPPLTLHHTDEVKREFDEYWLNETDFRALPEEVRSSVLNEREVFLSYISIRHGLLSAYGYKPVPDEKTAILQRFARVFEQTYTRFLDLKKAEEQAREAQIEAALERVRAKAMGMHSSEDLAVTISVVFQELKALHITPMRCGVGLIDETRRCELFTSTTTDQGEALDLVATVQLEQHPVYEAIFAHWERQQEHHLMLQGEDLISYYRRLKPEFDVPDWQTDGRQYGHFFYFPEGGLYAWSEQDFEEEERHVFRKFTTVLGLTYRRYLDLKEAEEQAREAQIEAALERVRARAMGMHQSDELAETAAVLFQELEGLGITPWRCGFAILDEETATADAFFTTASGQINLQQGRIHFQGHPLIEEGYAAWKRRDPVNAYDLSGEALTAYIQHLLHRSTLSLPEWEADANPALPSRIVFNNFVFSHGFLIVNTKAPLEPEAIDVVHRFVKVFELTYTRFEDLQQAEARAREAVKAASLDRVRAEIASMRTANDLQRITPLLWRELTTLGVPFFRCGVFIIDEATEQIHTYLSTPEGRSLAVLHLPFDSAETTREAVEHWRIRQAYTDLWDRQQFVGWMQSIQEQGLLTSTERYQGAEEPPEQLALQFVPFTQGMLYVGSAAPLSNDQVDLVQALADAFSVAYARYEDFTRLEAAKTEVEATLADLKATQTQLIHSEKMASLGQMTAGIAHEIKNPLNFVNNFSEIVVELSDELQDLLGPHLDATLQGEADDFRIILADLKQNASVIAKHGRRADDIVRSMMQHAREGTGTREPTAINALVEEYANLAFHGMRASTPGFTAELERDYSEAAGQAPVMAQEMGRVLLNLLSNAFYAVYEQADAGTWGRGDAGTGYVPTVTISTRRNSETVEIRIADNGPGIDTNLREKIFEPFFTTKPTGSGTGLGLSLSYDIVTQGHGGMLSVEDTDGGGATFVVTLPV